MHLAQDLRGSRLSPEESHNAFSTESDMYGISQAEINDMLKEAYDIPAVNTYQEPKYPQSSPVGTQPSTGKDKLYQSALQFSYQLYACSSIKLHAKQVSSSSIFAM